MLTYTTYFILWNQLRFTNIFSFTLPNKTQNQLSRIDKEIQAKNYWFMSNITKLVRTKIQSELTQRIFVE